MALRQALGRRGAKFPLFAGLVRTHAEAAVGEPGVDEEDRLAQAARAPEKIRPDLGFDQNNGFRTNDTESAGDNAALVDGVIDFADVIGELALELCHSGGGRGGNDDFQVWHARFQRTDELSANVHLTDANGMRPKDMPVGDGLFEFRVVLGESLAEVFFPITAPAHTHEVIRRGRREKDSKKYIV